MNNRFSTGFRPVDFWLLAALFAIDYAFFSLHVIGTLAHWPGTYWSLEHDQSWPEYVQYFKELLCIVLLAGLMYRSSDRPLMLMWLTLFVWILIDDMGALHEQLGLAVAQTCSGDCDLSGSSRADGELIVIVLVALTLGSLIGVVALQSTDYGRKFSLVLTMLLGLFGVFAVGVDYLHAQIAGRILHPLLGLIEESGEMFSMSLICWMLLLSWKIYPDIPGWPVMQRLARIRAPATSSE